MKNIENELRDELRAAHTIIRTVLTVLTFDQKIQWSNSNERDNVSGEGMTRADERKDAIERGGVDALYRELKCADRIIVNARGLLSHHQCELWADAIRLAGVVSRNATRDDVRDKALRRAAQELPGSRFGFDPAGVADSITVVMLPTDAMSADHAAFLHGLERLGARVFTVPMNAVGGVHAA
ncbi:MULTISPECIES: hypothetical protein [Burkholderia cepacia complex]|uniref:Uncharacterized protein n=1 Tax=Burkholderia lata (strain ATCC 17760 / DSM 23089 / LMG 22485 / NCIMB 9086 / R18194 / 383) TaxID=482957 RepID=A0A6P2XNS6_BURL3|nr:MULTISPECIES: hypothetical protein [Burkholderia cepacia complex]VWC78036.1 hypothetical protein BLA18628_01019 [Burkholderia aenigmatica]VWD11490.1 hypothetical protein BLA18109_05259 [Burkholderia lata]